MILVCMGILFLVIETKTEQRTKIGIKIGIGKANITEAKGNGTEKGRKEK